MKKIRALLLVILCLTLIQVPVSAAVKKGLKKENGNYYYYLNGVKIKNKWRNITTKNSKGVKVTNRYYFDKNGKAYKAAASSEIKYNFVLKKIGGKYYGFDQYGHMIKGIYLKDAYVDPKNFANLISEKFYVFNSKTGVYSSSASKTLNKSFKVGGTVKTLKGLLVNKYHQKFTKKKDGSSCAKIGYTDYSLVFGHFVVQYYGKGNDMIYSNAYSR